METLTAHLEFVSHRAVARMLEIPLTPFAESCFLILDIEANKRLHFRDFIVALWQFLTLDAPNLIEFAFDVFEAHIGALNIELEGLGRQVEEVFGSRISAASTKYIRELMEKAPGMPVTPQQFKLLCARDPAILQPALDMQVKLRQRSGTKLMWQNASVTRRQIRNNQNWKDLARQLMPGVKARKDSFPGRANVWPTKQDGDEVARVAAMVYQEPDVFIASDKPLQHGRRHSMQHFVLHTEDVQQPHFSTPGHMHDVRGMWRHAVGNDRAWLRSSTKPAQAYNQTRDLSTGVFSGLGARSHNAEYKRVTRKQIQDFNPHRSGATGLQFKAPGFEKLVQAEVEASGAFEGGQIQMQRPKGRRSSAIMPEFEAADVLDDLYS